MKTLFLQVLAVSGAVSLLLAPLLLLLPALRRRYAAKTRWAMWYVLALVLLLLPLVPKTHAPVRLPVPEPVAALPIAPEEVPENYAAPDDTPHQAEPATVQGDGMLPVIQPPPGWTRTISWPAVLSVAWFAGGIGVLVWQGAVYVLTRRRLLRRSVPVADLEGVARELGLEQDVQFRQANYLDTPMTLGVLRPVILLPAGGADPAVLRHELMHIRRNDTAYKALMLVTCAVHWFNPLVWLMSRAAGQDVESCCDRDVVEARDDAYCRTYGELLLQTAAGKCIPFTTRFGGGKAQMRQRLRELFYPGRRSAALVWLVLVAAAVLGCLVACGKQAGPVDKLEDGFFYYARFRFSDQPEDTDWSQLTLQLVEFDESSYTVGKDLDYVTLPLSAGLRQEDQFLPELGQQWQEQLLTKLTDVPSRRSDETVGADVLLFTVLKGEIENWQWMAGAVHMEGSRYINETYGFALQLPESWAGHVRVEELPSGPAFYCADFPEGRGMLAQITVSGEDRGGLMGRERLLGQQGNTWVYLYESQMEPPMLNSVGEASQRRYQDMYDDLIALEDSAFTFVQPSGDTFYVNRRFGFTLQLPESWAGKYTVTEDVERREVYFFQKNHGDNSGLLFTLRAEDAATFRAEHEGKTDAEIEDDWAVQMHILGEGGGFIFYIDYVSDVNVDLNNEAIRAEYEEMDRDARSMMTAESFHYDDTWAQGGSASVDTPESWQGPYQAVLDSYYEAMTGEAESGLVQSMVAPYWSWEKQDDLASKLGFAYLDLNRDGIDELVLGWIGNEFWNMDEGYVFAIYTLVDGEAVLAVEGWDRCRYVVGEDGYLYQNGAGSAVETTYTKYRFSPEWADFLEPVERLRSWGDAMGNEGWEHITEPKALGAMEDAGRHGDWSIDEDEALDMGEGWMASGLTIQYTRFSEYDF